MEARVDMRHFITVHKPDTELAITLGCPRLTEMITETLPKNAQLSHSLDPRTEHWTHLIRSIQFIEGLQRMFLALDYASKTKRPTEPEITLLQNLKIILVKQKIPTQIWFNGTNVSKSPEQGNLPSTS